MIFGFLAVINASLALIKWPLSSNKPPASRRKIASPRETLLPRLSARQVAALPYPPDLFPGARDVETLYGVMRVYEWGPEDGMKVLMIHGDTTPGPMLGPIAIQLVDKGCRVILFDLWGRGYSDTPLDVPHDARLFTAQIFFAISSSTLSWTGAASGGFSLIGFSLGGGISMSFAAHFPHLVNSIVLLAPGGILRRIPEDYESLVFRYPSFVSPRYLRRIVGKILGVTVSNETRSIHDDLEEDVPQPKELEKNFAIGKQTFDVPRIVQWQFDHHKGFCYSFANTIKCRFMMNQESDWSRVCDIIKGKKWPSSNFYQGSKLSNSKLLAVFGESDDIVVASDVLEDLKQLLEGTEHIIFEVVPGGHGFPVPSCDEVVRHICRFWNI